MNVPEGYKYCSDCRELKPLDEFHNDSKHSQGKDRRCKDCAKLHFQKRMSDPEKHKANLEKQAEWRAKNPDKTSHSWIMKKYGSYAAYKQYLNTKLS